jgi:hypothetical protein
MFICESCGKKEGIDSFWFTVGPLSRGKCEMCGKIATCFDWQGYKKEPAKEKADLQKAVEILIAELAKDKSEGSYYYSWQANIAMAFQDEFNRYAASKEIEGTAMNFNIHQISNTAAKNFLDLLCRPTENTKAV